MKKEDPSTIKSSPFLEKLSKKISVGHKFVGDQLDDLRIKNFIDTGNYLLNAQISGDVLKGLPGNKLTILAGPSQTGKTFITQEIVKSAQLQGYDIIYYDTEGAQDLDSLKRRNLDLSKLMLIKLNTVEALNESMMELTENLKDGDKVLIVVDSLGMLSTRKEIEDTKQRKEAKDMTRAAAIKEFVRVNVLSLNLKNIPFVVINHTYAQVGMFVSGQKQSGGSGAEYSPSVSLFLKKKKDKASNGTVIGAIITSTLDKGRLSKPYTEIELNINYTSGLSRYSGLLNEALEGHFIEKGSKKGSFSYKGEELTVKTITKEFFEDLLFKEGLSDYINKKFSYSSSAIDLLQQIDTSEDDENSEDNQEEA